MTRTVSAGHKGPSARRRGRSGLPGGWGVRSRHQNHLVPALWAAHAPRHAPSHRLVGCCPGPHGHPGRRPIALLTARLGTHFPASLRPPTPPWPPCSRKRCYHPPDGDWKSLEISKFPPTLPAPSSASPMCQGIPFRCSVEVSLKYAPCRHHPSGPHPFGHRSPLPKDPKPLLLGSQGPAASS